MYHSHRRHGKYPRAATSLSATFHPAIYCGNDTMAAVTSPSVPLSQKGNAFIYAHVTLPSSCLTPVVLVNPNSLPSIYIAASGF